MEKDQRVCASPRARTSDVITHGISLNVDHVAVETRDLENSISWYCEFFGGRLAWRLTTFSSLSIQRLPGLKELVEISTKATRFHLFTRASHYVLPSSAEPTIQFQHICLSVPSSTSLRAWRERWFEVYNSGRYSYSGVALATEVDVDLDGNQSFYCHDINGLEFEFTYSPGGGTS